MLIVLSQAAQAFAERHEGGPPALMAVAEREVEGLMERGLEKIEDLGFHIFDWHGRLNFIMFPRGPVLMIERCEDEGEVCFPNSGPIPSTSESMPTPAVS